MAVVVFDPAAFKAAFPEFADVPEARLQILFTLATGLLDNTDASLVTDITQRTAMFYYIVAHMLALFGTTVAGATNAGPSGVVGRVSSATEGSVSTSLAYEVPASPGAAWWNQTQYGALYWLLMAPYRGFRYVAAGRSGIGHAVDFANRWRVPGLTGRDGTNSGTPGGA